MTKQNATNEKTMLEQGLQALQHDLLEILKNTKQVRFEKTSLFILKAWQHFLNYGDSDIFKKLFFIRVGNTTLFNKLGLKNYFEYNNIAFAYNVKKDSLKVAEYESNAKSEPLKVSFTEYQNIKKESLTAEQKEQRLFERLAGLPAEQKERLLAYLKTK